MDITEDIQKYLLSLTYTDNKEDETDDLQIKLQDRDGIWLQSWLASAVDAAAVATSQGAFRRAGNILHGHGKKRPKRPFRAEYELQEIGRFRVRRHD